MTGTGKVKLASAASQSHRPDLVNSETTATGEKRVTKRLQMSQSHRPDLVNSESCLRNPFLLSHLTGLPLLPPF
jgi:hypothetical protein